MAENIKVNTVDDLIAGIERALALPTRMERGIDVVDILLPPVCWQVIIKALRAPQPERGDK